jgi:hypothetical protein
VSTLLILVRKGANDMTILCGAKRDVGDKAIPYDTCMALEVRGLRQVINGICIEIYKLHIWVHVTCT